MAYIGVQPAEAYTSFAVQHFTTSATTSYTLDNPVANENEIALFINNVRQQPGSSYAYTASGTTLTLSAATSASDTMYCVFIGKAVQTVTPASGSVTNDMIAYPLAESGATVSTFNRTTSDGDIVELQKDGTTVGSIGVGDNDLYIGKTDGGTDCYLRFGFSNSQIIPASSSGGTNDNTLDLGAPTSRFNDLYMGGNIYLGGTGSANGLDDYETGTFTITLTPSTSGSLTLNSAQDSCYYTKVGRTVFVQGRISVSGSSSPTGTALDVGGLPFTIQSPTESAGYFGGMCAISFNGSNTFDPFTITAYSASGTTKIHCSSVSSMNSNTRLHFNFFYYTAS